jgi:histidinol dehydrogenase
LAVIVTSISRSNAEAVAEEVRRASARPPELRERVREILESVRRGGDASLLRLAEELDGVRLARGELVSSRQEAREAFEGLSDPMREALLALRRRIERYERGLLGRLNLRASLGGCRVWLRPAPLDSVGCYAPGGHASYPSTVLMLGVPGSVAGVERLVLATPPRRSDRDREIVLAAAYAAGFGEVVWAGGAQAVAALAYGTESVRPVSKILGPGNAYVQEAKRLVGGDVGTDFPAGPTELLLVVDSESPFRQLGYELAAQAEHSPDTLVGAVALGEEAGEKLLQAVSRVVMELPEDSPAKKSISERGYLCIADSLEAAALFANRVAPEHLLIYAKIGPKSLRLFSSAGVVSYGAHASSVYLDYFAGPSHVLPTGGAARLRGGLTVLDYVRLVPYVRPLRGSVREALRRVGPLVEAEGLPIHLEALRRAAGYGVG